MKNIKIQLHCGIGDSIVAKTYLDTIANQYDQIMIAHNKEITNKYRNGDPEYFQFLDDLGALLFSKPPYIFIKNKEYKNNFPNKESYQLIDELGIIPQKPELKDILCKGNSINLEEEYVVMTTKVRYLFRASYQAIYDKLWNSIKKLSQKYKIVILGEKEVEMSEENTIHKEQIYGIYNDIIKNISQDRILDLTIPALGIKSPNLLQLQQDCLIMKEAKFTITLGCGGNFCLAISTGNVVSFRTDDYMHAELMLNKPYPGITLTKNIDHFAQILENI